MRPSTIISIIFAGAFTIFAAMGIKVSQTAQRSFVGFVHSDPRTVVPKEKYVAKKNVRQGGSTTYIPSGGTSRGRSNSGGGSSFGK